MWGYILRCAALRRRRGHMSREQLVFAIKLYRMMRGQVPEPGVRRGFRQCGSLRYEYRMVVA